MRQTGRVDAGGARQGLAKRAFLGETGNLTRRFRENAKRERGGPGTSPYDEG
jgi:hypothetical protein